MSTVASPRLNESQVRRYRTEGYLVTGEPVFPQAKFDLLRGFFEDMLSRIASDQRPEAMDVPHFRYPELFRWLFADEVLDLVCPILGPDVALFSSHFICKPKGDGRRVPWHEDSFYWKGQLDPMDVVTVWLAIDPSTQANGCMRVIPRALHGYSEYQPCDSTRNVFPTEIKMGQFDPAAAVPIELQPNHASLHDGRIIHGSEANTSSIRRCGYTMRYISTRTKFHVEKCGAWHQIYLARGKDHAGNTYADATKAYPEMARFREASGKRGH